MIPPYYMVAQNSFQHLDFDATLMVSKYCRAIGEHIVIIFVTQ